MIQRLARVRGRNDRERNCYFDRDAGPIWPSFLLLDSKHVAGIILRSNGSGAYGGGTYDIIGPTGNSLGYPTVAAKAGDTIELFAVGLGPTNPAVPAGQAFSGAAPTTNPVTLLINNVSVTPTFAGLSGAGLYQINLTFRRVSARGMSRSWQPWEACRHLRRRDLVAGSLYRTGSALRQCRW